MLLLSKTPADRAVMRRCSGPIQHANGAALARFEHLAGGLGQQKDIAMRHGQHHDDFLRHVKGAQRLQDVHPGSGEDQQRRESHGGFDARSSGASRQSPLRGDAEVFPPGVCNNGVPGVRNSAGSAITPVKSSTASQTRLAKGREADLRQEAEHHRDRQQSARTTAILCESVTARTSSEQSGDANARVERLQQAGLSGHCFGDQRTSQGPREADQSRSELPRSRSFGLACGASASQVGLHASEKQHTRPTPNMAESRYPNEGS